MKINKPSAGLLTVAFVMVMGSAFAGVITVPDASSTGLLMALGIGGLTIVKRFTR